MMKKLLFCLTALLCWAMGSLALAAPAAQAQAPSAAPVQLSIAAQPLAQALNDLARQARLELIVQPALVAGRTAPAVA